MRARCQYDESCKNNPLEKSAFCSAHEDIGTKSLTKYLSGSELPYDPDRFNKYKGIKESHNCYAYAFDYTHLPKKCNKDSCPISYPQPGRKSGYPSWSKVDGKRCPDIIGRIMGDIPGVKLTEFKTKCHKTRRKIAVVADPENDYHFYRQDADGYWSHKPGATSVTRLDKTGRPIFNPQLASREGDNLNYKQFCSFMCVPTKSVKLKRGGKQTKRTKRRKH
jgi:hypothetical protein